MWYREYNMFSRVSYDSEANALKSQEILEEIFPR